MLMGGHPDLDQSILESEEECIFVQIECIRTGEITPGDQLAADLDLGRISAGARHCTNNNINTLCLVNFRKYVYLIFEVLLKSRKNGREIVTLS